jgi:hypothetical protein
MLQEKRCLFCLQAFTPKNPKGKFCSTRHRVAHFRCKRKLRQNAAIVTESSHYNGKKVQNELNNTEKVQKPLNSAEDIEELNKFREALNGR